jgi:hypothetical protein
MNIPTPKADRKQKILVADRKKRLGNEDLFFAGV